jgi:integrase
MKTGKAHSVPLTDAALAVLDRQAKVRANDYIFPGGKPDAPLGYNTFAVALRKIGITATPHSFRSVFRDACGDLFDVPRDLAEAQLAHSLGATGAAYRRLSAVEKRRSVLIKYAAFLNGETGHVVIPFPVAGGRLGHGE